MRLAGKALQGYYPTPEPIVEAIAAHLQVHGGSHIHLLDNSAGTGRALAALGKHIKLVKDVRTATPPERVRTYGVEPNLPRYHALLGAVDSALHASWFQTQISYKSFQMCFCNPPYDLDYEVVDENGCHPRLERTFLQRTTRKLVPDGVLALIIPQNQIMSVADVLASDYTRVACYRFPDDLWVSPEHQEAGKKPRRMFSDYFHQVVILAQRRHTPIGEVYNLASWLETQEAQRYLAWQNAGIDLPEFRPDSPCGSYLLPGEVTPSSRFFGREVSTLTS